MTEVRKRKLIEVSLPLEKINKESAREKSIRHGHPSTLHLWWARRPLAACRAVLFAQLVDDPSSHPDRFPTEEDQAVERKRLHDIIEELVVWENANDERVLAKARTEIWDSCDGNPPPILDPFAGGGSIPLEAQRLGLEARASDLNPVAVLINKALIEIPPKWAGKSPVFPGAAEAKLGDWPRATGLAEDIRRYGQWMRDEAEKRIGHLYPKTKLADGSEATVVAWIWARTVRCPSPACGAELPLISCMWLSQKSGRRSWLRPVVSEGRVDFEVQMGQGEASEPNKVGRGANFRCWVCESICSADETHSQLDGEQALLPRLVAIVADGDRRRVYLTPDDEHRMIAESCIAQATELIASDRAPTEAARGTFGGNAQGRRYGFRRFSDYFSARQLVALTTFSDLVNDARNQISIDAQEFGLAAAEAKSYGSAVATYLAFALSKMADRGSTVCSWVWQRESVRNTFARQAIPMTWDFVEMNMMLRGAGSFEGAANWTAESVDGLLASGHVGQVAQADATSPGTMLSGAVVSTDPPYYDNIGYADLSDFFYVWLRRSLPETYSDLARTLLTPKAEELIASPYRFDGDRAKADLHFERGFWKAFDQIRRDHRPDVPMTIFYAFKQAENNDTDGVSSTGWEKMLEGLMQAGLAVTATWPMRTERSDRAVGLGTNSLASSLVLACRVRESAADVTDRRGLIAALRAQLPKRLKDLQQGSIAPVDLAQAAIGPGMAVFSSYANVAEPDGKPMRVRTALTLINQVLAEVLTEQEGDLDADSRFALKWFEQYCWAEGQVRRSRHTCPCDEYLR